MLSVLGVARYYYFLTLDHPDFFRPAVQSSPCKLFYQFGGHVVHQQQSGVKGQKAVCLDVGPAPEPNLCVVYSFGLSDERWTFDNVMADYGCDVYTFDPTVEQILASNQSHPRVHYLNMTLGTVNIKRDHRGRQFLVSFLWYFI